MSSGPTPCGPAQAAPPPWSFSDLSSPSHRPRASVPAALPKGTALLGSGVGLPRAWPVTWLDLWTGSDLLTRDLSESPCACVSSPPWVRSGSRDGVTQNVSCDDVTALSRTGVQAGFHEALWVPPYKVSTGGAVHRGSLCCHRHPLAAGCHLPRVLTLTVGCG